MTKNRNQIDQIAKPFLRWAGSKKQILNELHKIIPHNFNRYIEPFAGSATLFFAIKPFNAILSDNNSQLMDTYKTVSLYPKEVATLAHSFDHSKDNYYNIRETSDQSLSSVEKAAKFIYLNRYSFNGVYRTNRQGKFNVPYGTRTGNLPSIEALLNCSIILKNAKLMTDDFQNIIKLARPGDFIYCDPPYVKKTGKNCGEYGPNCFKYSDLSRLLNVLKDVHNKGVKFILSYMKLPDLERRIPNEWKTKKVKVRRNISADITRRNSVEELLIRNF